jgi:hypothetical protein
MADQTAPAAMPAQACQVLDAHDIFVSLGVNQGDGLTGPDEVCAGDIYQIDPDHRPLRLMVETGPDGVQRIATASAVGHPGDAVTIEARHDLMGDQGDRVSLLLLSLPDGSRFVLPLSPMAVGTDYTLVRTEQAPEATGLADLLCVSFLRGTRIALANGEQRPIETLHPGDRVLTRDHGGQPLLWVGKATLRAVGPFAPVVIPKGTLGNGGDLIVSQHHRMFLYQRRKLEGMATSELLVQARHLVDGDRIFLREGGFADYFSLVFDRHEIIYAEGVPAESLMVSETTLHRLPPEMAEDVRKRFPGLNQNQHFGTEAGRAFLDKVGPQAVIAGRRPRG